MAKEYQAGGETASDIPQRAEKLSASRLRFEYTGMSGELRLKFDRVTNAANYSAQTALSPDGPWEDQDLSTASRVTIGGLTAGKVLLAGACANGWQGSSEYGGPATAMAV